MKFPSKASRPCILDDEKDNVIGRALYEAIKETVERMIPEKVSQAKPLRVVTRWYKDRAGASRRGRK